MIVVIADLEAVEAAFEAAAHGFQIIKTRQKLSSLKVISRVLQVSANSIGCCFCSYDTLKMCQIFAGMMLISQIFGGFLMFGPIV